MTRHWPALLVRQVLRHARRHKLLAALNVLSVALIVHLFRKGFTGTALFTAQDIITMSAVGALQHRGLQDRVALVGFDDFAMADVLDPGITVIEQDARRMGRMAAQALFTRMDGHDGPVTTDVVPSRMVIRGSGEIPPR